MERITSATPIPDPLLPEEQAVLKACALYALNDLLLREGKITEEKKRAVDFEIWKQYRF